MNKRMNISDEDKKLLELIHQSNITIDDIKWLKTKKNFKKYVNHYSKEVKKRINPSFKKQENINITNSEIEVLDFTKTIQIPSSELIELFGFAKDIDVTNIEDLKLVTEKVKKRLKKEQLIWSLVLIVCILIFSSVGIYLISWQLENNKTRNLVKKMQAVAKSSDTKSKVTTTKLGADIDEPIIDENINFENLLKMNSDTKGWIKVNGTNIDYAFVQTDNNDYYLNHSYDKSYNKKGWVFMDYRNSFDKMSDNTILYAHGLLNKVMFGTLKNVVKEQWYSNSDNRRILITIPNGYYLWEVFSTYTIEPENYYITTNFNSKKEYNKFISTIKSRSVYNYDINVGKDDKILTLSSCYDHSKRVVLHAKLIKTNIDY